MKCGQVGDGTDYARGKLECYCAFAQCLGKEKI